MSSLLLLLILLVCWPSFRHVVTGMALGTLGFAAVVGTLALLVGWLS